MVGSTSDENRLLEFQFAFEPNDSLLNDQFFPAYDRSFVLPSEKEEIEGFRACLALNQGAIYNELSRHYGPYREYICVARDRARNIVGGANFIWFAIKDPSDSKQTVLTINLNYVFILPEHRGKGYLRPILNACRQRSQETLVGCPPLMFFEQNDPLRMSTEDYELDSRHSGLDQIQRIQLWSHIGARLINFPYVQPALSKDQKADHSLMFCVIGIGVSEKLSPCLLKAHMERFFHISVLKGEAIHQNADASSQIKILNDICEKEEPVRLFDGGRLSNLPKDPMSYRGQVPSCLDLLRPYYSTDEVSNNTGGKLHLTISVRLDLAAGECQESNAGKCPESNAVKLLSALSESQDGTKLDNKVRSYVYDIADTNRILQLHTDSPERFIGLPKCDSSNDPCQHEAEKSIPGWIDIKFPNEVKWEAEGEYLSAEIGSDTRPFQLKAYVRAFWFRHVDRSMTFNMSFEVAYSHRLFDCYALSALQEALFSDSENARHISEVVTIVPQGSKARYALREYVHQVINSQLKSVPESSSEEFLDGLNIFDSQVTIGHAITCLARATFLFVDELFFELLNRTENARDPGSLPTFITCDNTTDNHKKLRYSHQDLQYLDTNLGAMYFLSGFVHKVIDFLRQDGAEVRDGTDFHYPKLELGISSEELERNEYILYANDTCVYEFVRESRSLESANKYIGTCPYLFYVHMMTLHDEALIRSHEGILRYLIQKFNKMKSFSGRHKDTEQMDYMINQFNSAHVEIFKRVEQFKSMNVLRYDTEQNFYAAIREVRGFEERFEYGNELIKRLENNIKNFREKIKGDSEESLNQIVLLLTFFTIAQTLFMVADSWEKPTREITKLNNIFYITAIALTFVVVTVLMLIMFSNPKFPSRAKVVVVVIFVLLILFNLYWFLS